MELPVIRDASQEELAVGKNCQSCDHWLKNPHSYVMGVCIVGGSEIIPRWSEESQVCDAFAPGGS